LTLETGLTLSARATARHTFKCERRSGILQTSVVNGFKGMAQVRRKPSQERSKEKVELILSAAKALIGSRGNDAVSMREIAKHCGIAPSSIYQYFPDKNALLAAIMDEYYAQFRGIIESSFSAVSDLESICEGIDKGVDQFYKLFIDEPLLATIWSSVQANTVLRNMDIADSKQNAERLTDLMHKLYPSIPRHEIYDSNFLFNHMIESTSRLALSVGNKEGKRLIKSLKTVFIQHTKQMVTQARPSPK